MNVVLETTSFIEIRPDYSPIFCAVIKTDTGLTGSRYWVGFSSATMINGDDQTGAYISFRYSAVGGDTGWRAIVDTGSAQTVSANIGTVTVSTQYKLEIQVDWANQKCYFRVNGGAWTTVSAIPPTGTTLGWICGISAGLIGARTINISRIDGNHN